MTKTSAGNFFEDFRIGQTIRHATPRTVTVGDVALYNGLFGPRFAVQSSDAFAQSIGYPRAPVDDLLVFHIVFGKTVPDVSLNAVANLGYAGCRFLAPVYPGDTLNAASEVIGLKENSSRKTGIVFVRSTGFKQDGSKVLEYVRWVMVRKRDEAAPAPADHVPRVPEAVLPTTLGDACPPIDVAAYDFALAGSPYRFGDYAVGEKIDHVDGITVEEAEHQIATRLYQNTARIHFNQFAAAQGRFGRRLIYGGHVISLARALSFNGLGQCLPHRGDQRRPARVAAVRGRHRVRLVGGAGQGRAAGTRRCRRAAAADRRHQGPSVRRFPAQGGQRGRPGGAARPRLLGAAAAVSRAGFHWRMSFSENRFPLFRDMRYSTMRSGDGR